VALSVLEQAFPLESYLLQKFSGARLQRYSGDEIAIPCPVCDPPQGSAKNHLWVNLKRRQAVCYRCYEDDGGRYGDVVSLVADLERCSYLDSMRLLRDRSDLGRRSLSLVQRTLEQAVAAEQEEEKMAAVPLPEGFTPAWGHALPPVFAAFYRKRGISEEARKRHGIGYTTQGYYGFRSIVPLVQDGTRWSWVGRSVLTPERLAKTNLPKKIVYPKGSRTSRLLFNYDTARKHSTVALVEGVYDAMRVGPRGLAFLGSTLSDAQVRLLIEAGPSEVVLMLDPDLHSPEAAARATARMSKLAARLAPVFASIKVVLLERDPDEYSRSDLWKLAGATLPYRGADRLSGVRSLRSRLADTEQDH
jgi:DNA primase